MFESSWERPNSNIYCKFHTIERLPITGLGHPRGGQTAISIVIFIWLSSHGSPGRVVPRSRQRGICVVIFMHLSSFGSSALGTDVHVFVFDRFFLNREFSWTLFRAYPFCETVFKNYVAGPVTPTRNNMNSN